jgi:hypothetical protein
VRTAERSSARRAGSVAVDSSRLQAFNPPVDSFNLDSRLPYQPQGNTIHSMYPRTGHWKLVVLSFGADRVVRTETLERELG